MDRYIQESSCKILFGVDKIGYVDNTMFPNKLSSHPIGS
jgi:hypothetical protein